MCGIIGYIGSQPATPILLNGLRAMEYRGYDSAGLAVIDNGHIETLRCQGKVANLVSKVEAHSELKGTTGIAHTRWATHGAPNENNAHPHTVEGRISVVHNGIIENFSELKSRLQKMGHVFVTDTDTEVVAHLIYEYVKSHPLAEAVRLALNEVEGTFGLAVLDKEHPELLVAARRGSPLLLGIGNNEIFIASDAAAIIRHTNQVIYLEDDEIAVCTATSYELKDLENHSRERTTQSLEIDISSIEKGGYAHFLLKEIMEQPDTITSILRGRLDREKGSSHLGGLNLKDDFFRSQQRFLSLGCGTAYYAGLLGKYLLEKMTGIPVDVEYASEFRYRNPALTPNTLALIISQSGETADTLASLREVKQRGIPSLGLVNVVGSSVAREVDGGIYLHAGPEISVASTKAFSSQVVAELLLGLYIARTRSMSVLEGQEIIEALEKLPGQVATVLKQAEHIQALAKKFAHFEDALYLGRDSMYPVALESSHKLKEISYIHAEAYPAGEMKHGANALIDERLLVVFIAPENELYAKSRSNLEEVKARGGTLLVVTTEGNEEIAKYTDSVIYVPKGSVWTAPLLANIPLQLFAYYVAVERGTDVDQPRNLAKSVTVE